MVRSIIISLIYEQKYYFDFHLIKMDNSFYIELFIVSKGFNIMLNDLEISTLGTSYHIMQKSNL